MPGRSYQSSSVYRFGFNGKENDLESGTQDYGMRIYNPALGKFLSADPLQKEFAWNSSYAFAENDVIRSIDLDGAEKNFVIQYKDKSGTMLWSSVPYSKVHPGVQNGPLGRGELVYTLDTKTKQFTGHYVKTYKEANPSRAYFQDLDRSYQDEKGLKEFSKDLGDKVAPVVEGIGIVVSPFNPALGIGIYEIGSKMEVASSAVEVGYDIKEGNGKNLAVDLAAGVANHYLPKIGVGNEKKEVGKFIANVVTDKVLGASVNATKEKAKEVKVESQKK